MSEIIRNLDITSLVHGGRGIGRHQGKAVFVPLTLPGDRIDCRVIKAKRRFVEAELLLVTRPSPLRREPPCPLFGDCGGCQWQHIPYPEQARWKEQIFAEQMLRNLVISGDSLLPTVSAPQEWQYRNRIQLKCQATANSVALGFYRHGSHTVVDLHQCLLVDPRIQHVLECLRMDLPEPSLCAGIEQLDLSCGDDGEVRVVLYTDAQQSRLLRRWLSAFAEGQQISACLKENGQEGCDLLHGSADLAIKVDQPELTLNSAPGGFVQVNSAQNRNMVATMLELLQLDGRQNVLDLFCGMGNFSLPIARRAKRVVGVEDSAVSIASARRNAMINRIGNAEFHSADAASILACRQTDESFDLVVLDPPRGGNYQAICELLKVRPEQILYISCDPATLVRDLAPLLQNGYEVASSQPFDLFPQTWHIESMTMLRKR